MITSELTDIEKEVLRLKEEGKTFTEIGFIIKRTPTTAGNIFKRAKFKKIRPNMWCDSLGGRAYRALRSMDIKSKEEALNAIMTLKLKPGTPRNFGFGTFNEICDWLDRPDLKIDSRKAYKLCPKCGHRFI